MKKRTLVSCLLLIAIATVSLASCKKKEDGKHRHWWTLSHAVRPTCTTDGHTEGKFCEECGQKVGITDLPALGHAFENHVCTRCGERELVTEGLIYTPIDGGSAYEISGIENTEIEEIYIPNNHEGHPVTRIGESAFAYNRTLQKVVFPDTLKEIGNRAFQSTSLASVTFPPSLERIGQYAFYSCSLSDLCFEDGMHLTEIGSHAFANCHLTELVFAEGSHVESIGSYAFNNGTRLLKILLNGRIDTLGTGAFSYAYSLKEIHISKESLSSIPRLCFAYAFDLEHIYYGGTVAEWEALSKDSLWDDSSPVYTVICQDGTVTKDEDPSP